MVSRAVGYRYLTSGAKKSCSWIMRPGSWRTLYSLRFECDTVGKRYLGCELQTLENCVGGHERKSMGIRIMAENLGAAVKIYEAGTLEVANSHECRLILSGSSAICF